MRGEVRKQPELRARQAHRPGAGRTRSSPATRSRSSRASSTSDPMSRPKLEHALGLLRTVRAALGVAEREMGARELEPDLDGQPGDAVVEQRPQTVRACQRRAGLLRSRLVERDTRRRGVRDRARAVVAEARLLDELLCAVRASRRLAPCAPLGREQRELCLRPRRPLRPHRPPSPSRPLPRARPSRDRLHPAARARRLE